MQLENISQSEIQAVEGGMINHRDEAPLVLPEGPGTGGGALRVNFSYWSDEYVFLP